MSHAEGCLARGYKTEPHLHLSEVSRCSHLCADDMLAHYKAAGYHTVFVTDHLKASYFKGREELSWREKMEWFFTGYDAAKALEQKHGITVLPGVEVLLACSPNHYLLYGITKELLFDLPGLFDMTPAELFAFANAHGVFVVQAHPYRDGVHSPTPESVHAVEAVNTNPRHENFEPATKQMAQLHGLPITSGSDAHRPEDVGLGGVLTERPIESAADYIEAVKRGAITLLGEEK